VRTPLRHLVDDLARRGAGEVRSERNTAELAAISTIRLPIGVAMG